MEVIRENKFDDVDSPSSVGLVETKLYTYVNPPDVMVLDSGQKISPVTIAFETYGNLNSEGSNAVLIFHALSGDAHAAGFNSRKDAKPGWWDIMIGPGKPFDSNKHFIICANIIGGCRGSTGPSSMNPSTGKPYGLTFPEITIKDMVKPQKTLIEHLGIKKLLCVAGGSMGAMQALQWIVSYPGMSEGAVIIATTPQHTALQIAFNSIGRYAIISDPAWNNGDYYGSSKKKPDMGLSIARMIGHITYLSEEAMHKKFGRKFISGGKKNKPVADFTKDFEVESYLQYQSESFIKRFDANSYLYISKAIDNFNIAEGHSNLAEAFKGIKARCLLVSFSSDWLYPKEQSLKMVRALKINGIETTYINIESEYGHDAFLIEDRKLKSVLKGFLSSLEETGE
ncbi:MAG: homoserine O-acetyltransferase [Actinobacteria bacterium]|nr:homoserine O-acetyltransferase [Actinomycetota bacterium]